MNKLFDIIIVNYNSARHAEVNIEALLNSKFEDCINIILIDNNSSEDPLPLKHKFPRIELILNKKNVGFAAASNQAILQSRAPYIVLINPDAYVEKKFFRKVLSHFQKNETIGIMGPRILNYDGSVQGSARAFPSPLTALFGRNSYLTRLMPNNAISRANVLNLNEAKDRCMDVDWVSGACMIIRRDALAQTGNLDDRFFMYWEDADLCRRMWEKGWKVVYYPKAVVHHQVGQSSRTMPYGTIMHFHKSAYSLFAKYSKSYYRFADPLVLAALAFRAGVSALLAVIKTHKYPK